MSRLPTADDVRAAAAWIAPHVHRTSILRSRAIDKRTGASVFMKAEHLQKVGAFKARGATNAILHHQAKAMDRGVVTHSSGNHGQAVAYAASVIGARATVVVSDVAPPVKVEAIKGYGAEVVLTDQETRAEAVQAIADETGALVVHPFDDEYVIAGQGTAVLELLEEIPDLDVIVTPVGGGGLLSGSTLVANEQGIPTVGVEPEVVDDAFRSLRDGVRYPATGERSVGEGLLTGIGELPFQILMAGDTGILTVSEEEIIDAQRFVVSRTKQLVEASSATVFAAMFARDIAGARIGTVISGGNVDLASLAI